MKRFTVMAAILSFSALAIWAFFGMPGESSSKADNDNIPVSVHDITDETLNATPSGDVAVSETGAHAKIAPVYDSTGELVSDPTGTISNAAAPGASADMKIAPVYDAMGELVSDPTGTISSATDSGNLVVPVTGVDMKIAPVYDATGALVSDPTGTIWSETNP